MRPSDRCGFCLDRSRRITFTKKVGAAPQEQQRPSVAGRQPHSLVHGQLRLDPERLIFIDDTSCGVHEDARLRRGRHGGELNGRAAVRHTRSIGRQPPSPPCLRLSRHGGAERSSGSMNGRLSWPMPTVLARRASPRRHRS